MKYCTKCKKNKEDVEFYPSQLKSNMKGICKLCFVSFPSQSSEGKKKYHNQNPDKVKLWKQRDYIKNRITYIYGAARKRAIDNGLEFSITIDDIIIPEFCPILGIKIICDAGNGRTGNAPSIDRKDNTKGYTKDNIIIVSDRANKIKNDSSEDERAKLFYNVKKLLINQFFEDNNEENM